MKRKLVGFYALFGLLILNSCAENKSPIVGNWEVVEYYIDYSLCKEDDADPSDGRENISWDQGEYMKFQIRDDGTLTREFDMGLGLVTMEGTWVLENDLFTFTLIDDGSPRVETVMLSFQGDNIVTFKSEEEDCHISGSKSWTFVLNMY